MSDDDDVIDWIDRALLSDDHGRDDWRQRLAAMVERGTNRGPAGDAIGAEGPEQRRAPS